MGLSGKRSARRMARMTKMVKTVTLRKMMKMMTADLRMREMLKSTGHLSPTKSF